MVTLEVHARCCQTQAEDQSEAPARTSGGNNNDDDSQGGDMPSWMLKQEPNSEVLGIKTQKKKQAKFKKNDNHATKDVQEGTTEGKCVAGPMFMTSPLNTQRQFHSRRSLLKQ